MPEVKARTRLTFHQLVDGQSSYTHIRYSNDGRTFTPASAAALENAVDYPIEGRNIFVAKYGLRRTYVGTNIQNQTGALGAFSPIIEHHLNKRYMRISARVEFINCTFAENSMLQFQGNGRTYGWGPAVRLHKATGYTLANGVYDISTVVDATNGQILRYQTSTEMLLRIDYITGTIKVSNVKYEFVDSPTSIGTPYSPAPEDAAIGTTAGRWRGELVSDSPIASAKFEDYTWIDSKGEKGDTGRSVTSMKTQFALSSSSTNAPTGVWVDVAPNWEPNTFLWTRIHTTYSDGSTSATNAVLDNAWETKKMLSFSDDNLLFGAAASITNKNKLIATYDLSTSARNIPIDELVTVVLKGDIGASGRVFQINRNWTVQITSLDYIGGGLYIKTFPWKVVSGSEQKIYIFNNFGAVVNDATIEWVKLVRGTHTSLQYTPSQEELKKSVDAAKARAEDTYTKAAADGIITAAETRAIWRSRAEALRTQADYDRARLSAEYAKIRPQPHIVGSIATELQQKHEQFRGAAAALIIACQSAINHAALTEGVYNALIISSNKKNAYDSAMAALIAVLGAAVELGETGGRNFFGFRKGMVLAALNANVATTLEPSMNGIRMRINTAIPAHSSDRILVRLQRLGFERAGNYTASFRVRANRAMAADTLHVNVCDAGLKRFTPSTTEQRVVTTANVTSYYQASSDNYNGFIDFELAAGKTLNAGDVIDIIDLMIERGRTPSDYKMAEEDATYVQRLLEDTLQLEKVDVTSEKGVAMAGRFDACERLANGGKAVRAFMNGLTNGVRPTFAAGVTNFGTPDERYKTAFYHNGSGHIGPIAYTEDGTMYVGEYGKPNESRLFFNPTMIGGIDELKKDNTISVFRPVPNIDVLKTADEEGLTRYENSIGAFITIKPSTNSILYIDFTIDVSLTDYYPAIENSQGFIEVSLWQGLNKITLAYEHFYKYQSPNGGTITVRKSIKNPAPGDYSLYILADSINKRTLRLRFANTSGVHAFHQVGLNDQPITTINPNGFVSFYNPTKFVAVRDGQLMVRGEIDTDSPVVLASGYVDEFGTLERGKGRATRAERRSTGEYLIHHTIGHTDYAIVISPIGNGDLLVGQLAASSNNLAWCYIKNIERKNVNGVSTMTNSAFTFAILGRQ